MDETEFLKFIGGPHDGEYREVYKRQTRYKVFMPTKPKVINNDGIKPCNESMQISFYERKDSIMVFKL